MNNNETVAKKLMAGISSSPDRETATRYTDGEFIYQYTVRNKILFIEIVRQLVVKPDFELLNKINLDAHVGRHAVTDGNVYSYEAEFHPKELDFSTEDVDAAIAIADTEAQNAYTMLSNMTAKRVKELQRISKQSFKKTMQ